MRLLRQLENGARTCKVAPHTLGVQLNAVCESVIDLAPSKVVCVRARACVCLFDLTSGAPVATAAHGVNEKTVSTSALSRSGLAGARSTSAATRGAKQFHLRIHYYYWLHSVESGSGGEVHFGSPQGVAVVGMSSAWWWCMDYNVQNKPRNSSTVRHKFTLTISLWMCVCGGAERR